MVSLDGSPVTGLESDGTLPKAVRWGEALGYPVWAERVMPAVHSAFNAMNRYVGVPRCAWAWVA